MELRGHQLGISNEIIIDSFAGGGGASTGIEQATGHPVNIAINHDAEAVAMHAANHPYTKHFCEDVWEIDPREVEPNRPISLFWASPDCRHFSKAKGGKPVSKKVRGLAWVVLRWADLRKPRIICLENVEEFVTWCRVTDGTPSPKHKGENFRSFTNALRHLGYQVEWRELRACDYGAPTIRKRFFLIARRDGRPIVWPKPTHSKAGAPLKPWRTAAEIIDWTIPCPSIFERKKPLADNTQRRIAKGIMKYVVNNPKPFIVKVNHGYDQFRGQSIDEPLQTITSKHGYAVVSPTLVQTGYGEREGQSPRVPGLDKPLGTIMAGGGKHALVAAFLAKHYGGVVGHGVDRPASTVTCSDHHSLVSASIIKMRGTGTANSVEEPLHTITAGGLHYAEVRAFLIKYFGTDQDPKLDDPLHTVTTKDRFGLVTIHGQDYEIADIGMRMLTPRELYRAQGFDDTYIIDRGISGKPLSKVAQVRMCGNSVSPVLSKAIVGANLAETEIYEPANDNVRSDRQAA